MEDSRSGGGAASTSSPSDAVYLAAAGAINALGATLDEIWPRVLAGDSSGIREREDLISGHALPLGSVDGPLPSIPSSFAAYACRNNQLSLAAVESIRGSIEAAVQRFGRERIGVVMGTSTSGSEEAERAIFQRYDTGSLPPEFAYATLEFGGAADFVSELLDLRGPAYSISTACSSGARALASARSLLRLGVCDAVIAGAADSLCRLTTHGFSSLQAVSPEVTNPFSANRRGLTLGEGAAVFLVTREPGRVRLSGVGESSEAHHMSAPDPEGKGAEASMLGALHDAGLAAHEIAYLNLHGTGTELNDSMEAAAVHRLFGSALACSSSKPLIGHTLAAAGAMGVALCWRLIHEWGQSPSRLPPHLFDGVYDPELPPLALVRPGSQHPRPNPLHVMSNSFGFGGNNCSIVLSESDAC